MHGPPDSILHQRWAQGTCVTPLFPFKISCPPPKNIVMATLSKPGNPLPVYAILHIFSGLPMTQGSAQRHLPRHLITMINGFIFSFTVVIPSHA